MKEVTREGDANRYFLHKGCFITLRCHGEHLYTAHTDKGKLTADTQRGIKELIKEGAK